MGNGAGNPQEPQRPALRPVGGAPTGRPALRPVAPPPATPRPALRPVTPAAPAAPATPAAASASRTGLRSVAPAPSAPPVPITPLPAESVAASSPTAVGEESGEGRIDVNRVISAGTRSMDLDELARQGHSRVKVIHEDRIIQLIEEAVNKAVSARSKDLLARQRRVDAERIRQEVTAEIQKKEQQPADAALVQELDTLRHKLGQAEQVIEEEKAILREESRQQFQKLFAEQQRELEERTQTQRRLVGLENQLLAKDLEIEKAQRERDEAQKRLKAEVAKRSMELKSVMQMLHDTEAQLQSKDQDIALIYAEHKRLKDREAKADKEIAELRLKGVELENLQQDLALAATEHRRLKDQVRTLEDGNHRLSTQMYDAEERASKLLGEVKRLETDLAAMRAEDRTSEEEKNRKLQQQMEELSDRLEKIHGTTKGMGENLEESIIRQVAWAVHSGKSGALIGVGGSAKDQAGVQLDAVFAVGKSLETNVESFKVEQQKGGGMMSAIDKLKKLGKPAPGTPGGAGAPPGKPPETEPGGKPAEKK